MKEKEFDMTYRYEGEPREVKPFKGQILEIESQPGDCTRYRYLLLHIHDSFHVVNHLTEMKYPKVIFLWEVKIKSPQKIAKEHDCNPWTAKEVINAIKENFNIETTTKIRGN